MNLDAFCQWQTIRLQQQLNRHAYQPVSHRPPPKVVQLIPDAHKPGLLWNKCVCGRRCRQDRSRCNRCRQADRRIANRVGWHMPVPRTARGGRTLGSQPTPVGCSGAPRQYDLLEGA